MSLDKQHEFEFEHNLASYELAKSPWWHQILRSPIPYLAVFAVFIHWGAFIPLCLCLVVWGFISLRAKRRRFQIRFKKWFRIEVLEYPFRLRVGGRQIEIVDKNGKYFDSISSDEIEEIRFESGFVCVDHRSLNTGMPETLELREAQFPNEDWDAVKTAFGPEVWGNLEEDDGEP